MIGFTYAQLAQALQDWPVVPQAGYIGNIGRFVELGELRVVKDVNLEIYDQTSIQLIEGACNTAVKPAELLSLRSMWWREVTGSGVLELTTDSGLLLTTDSGEQLITGMAVTYGGTNPVFKRSLAYVQNFSADPTVFGPPRFYAELDSQTWIIAPPSDQPYGIEARFIIRPPSIVSSGTSWLGDRCGDLLFLAALMEAEHFLKADDRFADLAGEYSGKMQSARIELRNLIRDGDYQPIKAAAAPAQGQAA